MLDLNLEPPCCDVTVLTTASQSRHLWVIKQYFHQTNASLSYYSQVILFCSPVLLASPSPARFTRTSNQVARRSVRQNRGGGWRLRRLVSPTNQFKRPTRLREHHDNKLLLASRQIYVLESWHKIQHLRVARRCFLLLSIYQQLIHLKSKIVCPQTDI